jgi:hypothetical protein
MIPFFFKLPAITEMMGVCHHAQLFSSETRSYKLYLFIFAWAGLDPPHPSLLSKLG